MGKLRVLALVPLVGVVVAASVVETGGSKGTPHGKRVLAQRCAAGLAAEANGECVPLNGPESVLETTLMERQWAARSAAPFDTVAPGAYASAVAEKAKRKKTQAGGWKPLGASPLYANSPDYAGSDPVLTAGPSQLGWVKLSGRVTSFAHDPAKYGRIFVASSDGGVFESADMGFAWRSIADNLPTQVVGAIAYSSAAGGTIVVATGDNAVGGVITPSGLGVYTSRDDGGTWRKAAGVPDGLTSYKVAVDPGNPSINYVATSKGLYRSVDNGVTYRNVVLPTGCTDLSSVQCGFANVVTDVDVQAPNGLGTQGGAVIAAVGWAYGNRVTKSGIVMAQKNGIYTSTTGEPGTFAFQDPGNVQPSKNGFAPTPIVGRTSLAVANGAGQNHAYVYALVQDAQRLQGCLNDDGAVPACAKVVDPSLATATFLDGGYVSKDFGKTWTKIMDGDSLRAPGTNSALELGLLGVGPGIQSWYNNWIAVDPTAKDAAGAPTRVLFGLEEIWQNKLQGFGVDGSTGLATPWKVIGRYWNACLLLVANTQCSDASSPIPGTTTHPDQHAADLVPDGNGGVTLLAGGDGGAYAQHVSAGKDFSNDNWGDGINDGLHTLQPYNVEMAKDGTAVMGLQDNGEVKISPNGRQDMIFGGDGFFTAIDPDNSNRIVEEYVAGRISGTTDGGKTWTSVDPQLSDALFATPLQLDPGNADHLLIAGRDVEVTDKPYRIHCFPDDVGNPNCVFYDNWTKVYDLGTTDHPGSPPTDEESLLGYTPNTSSAVDLRGDQMVVGYCGPCSVLSKGSFSSGIATNVGGSAPPSFASEDGWHIASAIGLPERYITSARFDPADPTGRTIYVTLGGYTSHWIPPGALGEDISKVGTGHVFVSRDAGEHFTDVSGDLPDVPADWVLVRKGQLIVGTDIGAFVSSDLTGSSYSVLGGNLPNVPVVTLRLKPGDPNTLVAATYGRGAYTFSFAR